MDLMYIFEANITLKKNESNFLAERPDVAIPYLIVLGLVMASGSFGNVLVIAAVLTNRHLKTEGNMFIVNLAIADLSVTAMVDPFSIAGVFFGKSWFDSRMGLCRTVAAVCVVSCLASLFNIGAISFNRYIHICHHSLYKGLFTFRKSLIMCLILWLVCVGFALPNFFGWSGHVFDEKTVSCLFDRNDDWSFTLFIFFLVALPTLLTTFCYFLIFRHVQNSKKKVGADQKGPGKLTKSSKSKNDSMKLARTLFIIFIVFVVCWTPFALLLVIDFKNRLSLEVHLFSTMLAHTNSSLNCILYGATNQHFRRGYRKVLGIDRCVGRRNKVMDWDLYSNSQTGQPVSVTGTTKS